MKLKTIVPLILLLLLGLVVWINYPKLNLISGYASKYMASSVYYAHRPADSINAHDNNVPLVKLASTHLDEPSGATAKVFGLTPRTAIYREGLGAVLINEDYDPTAIPLKPKRNNRENLLPYPLGNGGLKDTLLPEVDYQALKAALDYTFSMAEKQKTRTAAILYKGHLIGERYAPGFDAHTPILGWSMTKSVLATLYGILEYRNVLSVQDAAPVAQWQSDARKHITLDQLLRMQSGLAWEEDYSKISDVTQMLFMDTDMTIAQAKKEAEAAPAAVWNYSSGTSNLLSGILHQYLDTEQAYLDFPYSALIDKIGMHSMLLETDLAGNYVGSSYAWATTRDWAKFGLLYLNEGDWYGERLFAPEWISYITTPTPHSHQEYGAHFWLNAGGKYPDVPRDMYSANGYQGQHVYIIPSKDLVVVRTGLAERPDYDANGFLARVIAALP